MIDIGEQASGLTGESRRASLAASRPSSSAAAPPEKGRRFESPSCEILMDEGRHTRARGGLCRAAPLAVFPWECLPAHPLGPSLDSLCSRAGAVLLPRAFLRGSCLARTWLRSSLVPVCRPQGAAWEVYLVFDASRRDARGARESGEVAAVLRCQEVQEQVVFFAALTLFGVIRCLQ